jgi:hypothetical protein
MCTLVNAEARIPDVSDLLSRSRRGFALGQPIKLIEFWFDRLAARRSRPTRITGE